MRTPPASSGVDLADHLEIRRLRSPQTPARTIGVKRFGTGEPVPGRLGPGIACRSPFPTTRRGAVFAFPASEDQSMSFEVVVRRVPRRRLASRSVRTVIRKSHRLRTATPTLARSWMMSVGCTQGRGRGLPSTWPSAESCSAGPVVDRSTTPRSVKRRSMAVVRRAGERLTNRKIRACGANPKQRAWPLGTTGSGAGGRR